MLAGLLITVTVTAAIADWWAVHAERRGVEVVAKPLVMLGLISLASTVDVEPGSIRPWILIALACGLAGDVFLLPAVDRFVAGLSAFLVGHTAYVIVFALVVDASPLVAVGVAGFAVLLVRFAVPILRALRGSRLLVPVGVYIGVSGAVIVLGALTGRWLIAIGALAFALSDGLLGENRFVEPAPQRRVWIHVLYHSGQAAILAGAVTT